MSILVATDGNPHSVGALTFAAHLARAQAESITILTIVKTHEEQERAREILQRAETVVTALDVPFQTKMRIGHPAEEILSEAEEAGHHIAVLSEKQHQGFLTRFLLGSTALRVVEHAPCPVVVVKGQIGMVKRILLCDSGAPAAKIIDRVTAQVPRLLQSAESVTILHVMSQMTAAPGVDGHFLRADADDLIEEHAVEGQLFARDLTVLANAGVRAAPKVRHGRVVDEVLGEARQGNHDLVVIGAHAGTGWRRILLDDIAHQLVVQIDRPVLVIR